MDFIITDGREAVASTTKTLLQSILDHIHNHPSLNTINEFNQEIEHSVRYWEGAVSVLGVRSGRSIAGV